MKAVFTIFLAMVALAVGQIATIKEPALTAIQAAAATVKPELTTSDIKGSVFDRFYQVWFENIVSGER
jgi:acid phosphatase